MKEPHSARRIRKWHWTLPLGLLIGTLWINSTATPTMADGGSASLGLIAQSPWIDNEGDLAIQLRITGDAQDTVLRLGLHRRRRAFITRRRCRRVYVVVLCAV